ncbi:MAG TPA: heme-binding protein [Phycisphaerales bacterium]|jgi:cytochrome c551/c552|nr:heme-binding protein [Phycisphaerales bacterium]HIB50579.1 heme-binding protein [Phycisphaerales bacterium]HIN83444.1 heme-binding protein [Phycisphaerales bacterium]HIO20419.1 heme-binding protein [Phycisphaerales bacterium]HIO53142.1 heme-binding protein [Phycisphaerales bacterium]
MKCKLCKKSKLCKKCECIKYFIFAIIVVAIGIQFFPAERTNPPITGTIEAPEKVMAIIRRSCWDCHSNETVWPWYSKIAPISWLVADDVNTGRAHMNFSEWDEYNTKQKNHKRKECGEEVEEGEMPLWFYIPLHPEAELSEEEVETILAWSKGEL